MKKSFDDILKEGKNRAVDAKNNNIQSEWRRKIRVVMEALVELNQIYNDEFKNHFQVESKPCTQCGKVAFIIIAQNIQDNKTIRFSPLGWKRAHNGKYTCNKCSV